MTLVRTKTEQGYSVDIPPVMPETARILIAARERVAKRHCQDAYIARNGAVCALGGIMVVTGYDAEIVSDSPAGKLLTRGAKAFGHIGIVGMNDDGPKRQAKRNVLAAYDYAIELALKEGK